MPRKITTKEWKNRRDFNAWKIELDGYNMTDTHAKYDEAVNVIAKREEERIDVLKDTLWDSMVPFVGINITPPELKDAVEKIMNSKCIEDIVLELMAQKEQRVKDLEAEECARLAELRESHSTLVEKLDKAKKKANEKSEVSDSDSTYDDVSSDSEEENIVTEETVS